LTSDASTGFHYATRSTSAILGRRYQVRLKVYIPSSNARLKRVRVLFSSQSLSTLTLDAWTPVVFNVDYNALSSLVLYGVDSLNNNVFTGTAGDLFYIKDFQLEQFGSKVEVQFQDDH